MTKNSIYLGWLAVFLAIAYCYFFTGWFTGRYIRITPTIRPQRASAIPRSDDKAVYPVAFKLDSKYRLSSIKVVLAGEFETNKFAAPLWHMVAEATPRPTDFIVYGARMRGMQAKIPRSRPEPLLPNVPYTLLIEAGKLSGRTNFITREVVRPEA